MTRTKHISASQAAEFARVDRRTVINWCNDSKFDATKVGETWVVNERSFLEFLSARMVLK
jgi:hypothetical protein